MLCWYDFASYVIIDVVKDLSSHCGEEFAVHQLRVRAHSSQVKPTALSINQPSTSALHCTYVHVSTALHFRSQWVGVSSTSALHCTGVSSAALHFRSQWVGVSSNALNARKPMRQYILYCTPLVHYIRHCSLKATELVCSLLCIGVSSSSLYS